MIFKIVFFVSIIIILSLAFIFLMVYGYFKKNYFAHIQDKIMYECPSCGVMFDRSIGHQKSKKIFCSSECLNS